MDIKTKIWKYSNFKNTLDISPLNAVNKMSLLNVIEHQRLYNMNSFENTIFAPEMFNSKMNKSDIEHILIIALDIQKHEIVGYVYATFNKDNNKSYAVTDAIIQELYVTREYRHLNIGKRLIKHICEYLRIHRTVEDISIYVHKNNKVISLYNKFNFINTGHIGDITILSKTYMNIDPSW